MPSPPPAVRMQGYSRESVLAVSMTLTRFRAVKRGSVAPAIPHPYASLCRYRCPLCPLSGSNPTTSTSPYPWIEATTLQDERGLTRTPRQRPRRQQLRQDNFDGADEWGGDFEGGSGGGGVSADPIQGRGSRRYISDDALGRRAGRQRLPLRRPNCRDPPAPSQTQAPLAPLRPAPASAAAAAVSTRSLETPCRSRASTAPGARRAAAGTPARSTRVASLPSAEAWAATTTLTESNG